MPFLRKPARLLDRLSDGMHNLHLSGYDRPPASSRGLDSMPYFEAHPAFLPPAFRNVNFLQEPPIYSNAIERHATQIPSPGPESLLRAGSIEGAAAFSCDHVATCKPQITAAVQHLKNKGSFDRYSFIWEAAQSLDEAVFGGRLYRGGCSAIGYSDERADCTGHTRDHGHCIVTELNPDVVLAETTDVDQLLAILIHHMIHAFLLIYTNPNADPENGESGTSWSHGKAFGAVLYEIKKTTGLPLTFNHASASAYLGGPSSAQATLSRRSLQARHPEHGRSTNCSNSIVEISESDCSKWYNEKCKPLIDAIYIYKLNDAHDLVRVQRRSLPSSPGGYLEVICNKQNVYVPRTLVDKYAFTLGKQFTGKAVLSLPTWAKKDMLASIYQFLQGQSYKPGLAVAQETTEADKAKAALFRAPLLLEPKDKSHPFMLADIKMYKLAKQIKFDELAKYAMQRLETTHLTHENPIDALAEIYCSPNDKAPGTPDEKLRVFATNFLKRYDTVAPAQTPYESSNLHEILQHRTYKHGLAQLYGRDLPALREDYNRAWTELHHYAPAPPSPSSYPAPSPFPAPWPSPPMGGYAFAVGPGAMAQPQAAMPGLGGTTTLPYRNASPAIFCMADGTWTQLPGPAIPRR